MCATCVLAQFAPCVPPAGHTCATCATCVLPQFLPCVPPACCPSLRHVYVRTTSVAHMCHVCHLRAAPACASLRVRTYVGACVRAHVPARMRTHARCAGKSPRARGHAYVRSCARTYARVVRTYVRTYVRVGRHTYARTLPNACGREIRTYVRTYVAALGPERKEQFPLRIHQSSPCEAAGPRQVRTYVPYTRTYGVLMPLLVGEWRLTPPRWEFVPIRELETGVDYPVSMPSSSFEQPNSQGRVVESKEFSGSSASQRPLPGDAHRPPPGLVRDTGEAVPGECRTSDKGGTLSCTHLRLAQDNMGYTYAEFQEWYGENAEEAWSKAPKLTYAQRDFLRSMSIAQLNHGLMKPNVDPTARSPNHTLTDLQRELLQPAVPPFQCDASAASNCGDAEGECPAQYVARY